MEDGASARIESGAYAVTNKLALAVASIAMVMACRNDSPATSTSGATGSTAVLQLGACIDTFGEEHALACAPPTVHRDNHTLTIRLKNGHVLRYVNDSVGEVMAGTMYRGAIASIPLYITSSYGGERPSSYSLIDGRNGAALSLADLPLFSPDSTHYAISDPEWSDCELGSGGDIGVWRMTDTLPAGEFYVRSWACDDTPGWGASDLRWRSSDTLELTQNDIADKGRSHGAKRQKLLVRSGMTWRLIDPPGAR